MDPRWSQPPPGWQPPYQAWPGQDPDRQSGLLKAARVLLLVGSILSAVGAGFLLLVALFMGIVLANVAEAGFPGFIIGGLYGIFALFLGAGAICGFVAWRKAPGDLNAAFVWGLVGAILQGVNVVTLLGAIFAKTCPEAEAASRQRYGWAPPPQAR